MISPIENLSTMSPDGCKRQSSMVTQRCVSSSLETSATWKSSIFFLILDVKFLTKREQSSPKIMISSSCRYLLKLHTKSKMPSKKMPNSSLIKSKKELSILKTIHQESKLAIPYKKQKRKYFPHKLSNLNLKRKDVVDILLPMCLMMFYKFLSKNHL